MYTSHFMVASLALGQLYDCPSVSEITVKGMLDMIGLWWILETWWENKQNSWDMNVGQHIPVEQKALRSMLSDWSHATHGRHRMVVTVTIHPSNYAYTVCALLCFVTVYYQWAMSPDNHCRGYYPGTMACSQVPVTHLKIGDGIYACVYILSGVCLRLRPFS